MSSNFLFTGQEPHMIITQNGPGKEGLDSSVNTKGCGSYRVGLRCGPRENAACGLALTSKVQG